MKKCYLTILLILPFFCYAQPGYITRFAGTGAAGYSGDGGLATAAEMTALGGVRVDNSGNTYIFANRTRKVDQWGIITTIAGNGTSTADGIPATAADIIFDNGNIFVDNSGSIYFSERARIRKIDASTGIISTVAGNGATGISGDGGPATAAHVSIPCGIHKDASGNLYFSDANNARIRKVSTSGIITTIAGQASGGSAGDGGPASAAWLNWPHGLCSDAAGNLYIADRWNNSVRKIDASGIITTIAGTGSPSFTGDGGPATAAGLNLPSDVCMDSHNNLYIADASNKRIRKITPAGTISTVAGGGTLPSGTENVPATNTTFDSPTRITIDHNDNLYITDAGLNKIFVLNGLGGTPIATTGNFSVYLRTTCGNTEFTISPASYSPTLSVKTWFGDGHIQNDLFVYSNNAWFTHAYNMTGTYTVKHILFDGSSPIDSVSYSYINQFCRTFQVKVFVDENYNSIYDTATDHLNVLPIVFAVDSSGITIDSVTSTSCLSYGIQAPVGTVYTFRPATLPAGLVVSSSGPGVVTYTVTAASVAPQGYLAVNCTTTTSHDLRIFAAFNAGVNGFNGTILADNLHCTSLPATISMHLSPKYTSNLNFSPAPTSVSGTTVTWYLSALSSVSPKPFTIRARMGKTTGVLLPFGDTAITGYTITPTFGDANPANNMIVRIDTVRSGYDPNDISVSPPGCLTTETKLTYTIRFENTGNDTAHNIYVLDTLPAEVDVKSMRIVAASAVMNTYIKKTGTQNIVRFDFPDIKLPDSSHHGQNSGMVIYSINRYPTLADGTHIRNRVGIYFDDNPPVLTNTAENTIGCPITSVNDVESAPTAIYPNPVTKELFIETTSNIYKNYTISNSLGQTLLSNNITSNQIAIDTRQLPPGLYILTLRGSQTEVHKIIKQ
jgi:uncharacterized repeat protein (TIGR01451 family)